MDISVVIPVYGCVAALDELHKRLTSVLSSLTNSYEIVLVEDCCPENSWQKIKEIAKDDQHVTGIHFSRNFGQIKAITAGLDYCSGEWVVVMDCDLQDRPEAIIDLYNKAQEGYDVVFGRRVGRKDTKKTKFWSKSFYKVYNYFTESKYDSNVNNFSISRRIVIDSYCKMREQNRSYTMFINWLGFNQTIIDVQADARYEGESSYNFKRKMKMAFEVITSQSNKPLKLSVKIGTFVSLCSFIYIIYLVIHKLTSGVSILGWTSLIASIYLVGGILLAAIGTVGLYVGNIFDEVKHRPLYVVKELVNDHREDQKGNEL